MPHDVRHSSIYPNSTFLSASLSCVHLILLVRISILLKKTPLEAVDSIFCSLPGLVEQLVCLCFNDDGCGCVDKGMSHQNKVKRQQKVNVVSDMGFWIRVDYCFSLDHKISNRSLDRRSFRRFSKNCARHHNQEQKEDCGVTRRCVFVIVTSSFSFKLIVSYLS